jgi:CheY-like chemotaxis protein
MRNRSQDPPVSAVTHLTAQSLLSDAWMGPPKKKRILLAEDNVDSAGLIWKELEILGYEVQIARDGLQAVEMATAEPPDFIIMDIRLPKMDGLQATTYLSAESEDQGYSDFGSHRVCVTRREGKIHSQRL